MHTVITNGFGHTSNVGDLALLAATVNLVRWVAPQQTIYVMPWQMVTSDMEFRFHSLLHLFPDVHLINPLLPAPSRAVPFPEDSVMEKIIVLSWSIWMNLRAELGSHLGVGRESRLFQQVLKDADLIILRGCNIVQRDGNLRALASIRRVTFPLLLAQRLEKPTALLNISVGPVESSVGRCLVKHTLERATYISVRELLSAERVKDFTARQPVISADTAFAYPIKLPTNVEREPNLVGLNLLGKGEYLEAVQGSWKHYEKILKSLAEELNLLMRQDPKLRFLCIPHEMSEVKMLSDMIQLRKLVALLDYPEKVTILDRVERPEDVISAYARCSIALGMRFHGFVLAGLAATPMIGIDLNSQKVNGMAVSLGVNDLMIDLDQPGQLVEHVSKALESASELRRLVIGKTSQRRQVVLDSFAEFARSSGMSK
jgi:polysaccharide pyruvyl transferase WcaK-like protein